ncbi:hypothetical protein ACWGOK_39020 [Streptomyces eurythermus]
MADPADTVTLKLLFWHKDKKPGDTITVRRDEVRSWYGFAEPVDNVEPVEPVKADETAATGAQKTPAKTSTSKQA